MENFMLKKQPHGQAHDRLTASAIAFSALTSRKWDKIYEKKIVFQTVIPDRKETKEAL